MTLTAADILAPLALDTFLAEVFTRRFEVMRASRTRFQGLLVADQLLAALDTGDVPAGDVTLVHDGRQIPRARFCASEAPGGASRIHPGMLRALLAGGAAMIVAQMQRRHGPLAEVARALETVLRASVSVNVYMGGPGSRGFDLHVDHHDVVVMQASGRKRWHVAEPTEPWPLVVPDHTGTPPGELAWSGILEEGDVLYLPRGFWHRAEALDDVPTLHLSCGVQPCTGVHIVHWLARELMSDARFRAELPRFGAAADLRRRAGELRRLLLERWDDAMIERFVAAHDSAVGRDEVEPP